MEYQGTNYSWPSKNPTPQSISEGAWSGRIGLMYASDYVNAYQDNSRDNWLFIKNGMSGNRAEYEWTMSRYGYYYDPYISGYDAWSMNDGGKLYTWSMNLSCAVRPVFYLTRDISISGEGTESDPFIISDKIVS